MKIVMIILPFILAGALFGAASVGMVNIPGITPPPKKKAKKGPDVKVAEKKVNEVVKPKPPDPPPVVVKKDVPKPDLIKGDRAVADVWAEIPADKLVKIVEKWKDPALARVLVQMDTDKVAELLGLVKQERASKLSIEIQKLASAPVVVAEK